MRDCEYVVVDQLPRLGKTELVFLLLFTCSFVVSVSWRFLFLLVLGMGCAFFIVALPGPSVNYHNLDFLTMLRKLEFCVLCFFMSVCSSRLEIKIMKI